MASGSPRAREPGPCHPFPHSHTGPGPPAGRPLTRSGARGPKAPLTRGLCLRRGARGGRPDRAASLLGWARGWTGGRARARAPRPSSRAPRRSRARGAKARPAPPRPPSPGSPGRVSSPARAGERRREAGGGGAGEGEPMPRARQKSPRPKVLRLLPAPGAGLPERVRARRRAERGTPTPPPRPLPPSFHVGRAHSAAGSRPAPGRGREIPPAAADVTGASPGLPRQGSAHSPRPPPRAPPRSPPGRPRAPAGPATPPGARAPPRAWGWGGAMAVVGGRGAAVLAGFRPQSLPRPHACLGVSSGDQPGWVRPVSVHPQRIHNMFPPAPQRRRAASGETLTTCENSQGIVSLSGRRIALTSPSDGQAGDPLGRAASCPQAGRRPGRRERIPGVRGEREPSPRGNPWPLLLPLEL